MNKFMSLALIAVTAVSFAGAQTSKKPTDKKPVAMTCAVQTANKVDIAKATASHMYADYKGNRYFFCCGGCPEAFKKDPAKYAKSAHIPTPKATPVKKK